MALVRCLVLKPGCSPQFKKLNASDIQSYEDAILYRSGRLAAFGKRRFGLVKNESFETFSGVSCCDTVILAAIVEHEFVSLPDWVTGDTHTWQSYDNVDVETMEYSDVVAQDDDLFYNDAHYDNLFQYDYEQGDYEDGEHEA